MNSVSKLTDSLKRALRPISWRAYVWIFQNTSLAQRLIVSSYLQRPLATWPAGLGKLLDINVPLAVGPLPSVLPYGAANINNLIALLDATRDVAGDVAECGVFRGASLIAMALYASQNGMNKSFVGFDSFEGFAPAIAYDIALGGDELNCKQPGGMNETSRELVSAKAAALKLRNITLFEGFFNKTLLLAGDRKFSR